MSKSAASVFKFDVNSLSGLMIFSLPLSVKLFFEIFFTEIIYPAEIFIGCLAVWFCYDLIRTKFSFFHQNMNFFRHPLTLLVTSYVSITILSALFSTMPVASFKATLVKCSYIVVFYFLNYALFKSDLNNLIEALKIYSIALGIVIIYALANHYQIGIRRGNAGYASNPFYSDHTIYGAALAFLLPTLISFFFYSTVLEIYRPKRILIFILSLLFLAGLYFSFCRGAWISIIGSILLLLILKFRLPFYCLIIGSFIILSLILFNWHSIINSFKQNKNNSYAYNAGLYEQVFSLTNISNDPSNTERINRWSCAARMFLDKPLLGFGPGTYQFQYLQYQRNEEMTQISIKKPLVAGRATYNWSPVRGFTLPYGASALYGNGGSAHSEYFLALSETGIFSLLIFIAFYLYSLYTAFKIFYKLNTLKVKVVVIFIILGLTTYFIHSFFNNFLDDCKIAFLFWTYLCGMTALDVRLTENKRST